MRIAYIVWTATTNASVTPVPAEILTKNAATKSGKRALLYRAELALSARILIIRLNVTAQQDSKAILIFSVAVSFRFVWFFRKINDKTRVRPIIFFF